MKLTRQSGLLSLSQATVLSLRPQNQVPPLLLLAARAVVYFAAYPYAVVTGMHDRLDSTRDAAAEGCLQDCAALAQEFGRSYSTSACFQMSVETA